MRAVMRVFQLANVVHYIWKNTHTQSFYVLQVEPILFLSIYIHSLSKDTHCSPGVIIRWGIHSISHQEWDLCPAQNRMNTRHSQQNRQKRLLINARRDKGSLTEWGYNAHWQGTRWTKGEIPILPFHFFLFSLSLSLSRFISSNRMAYMRLAAYIRDHHPHIRERMRGKCICLSSSPLRAADRLYTVWHEQEKGGETNEK